MSHSVRNRLRSRVALAGLGLVSLGLAGCQTTEPWTEPSFPSAYTARHPIELTNETRKIEIFPSWAFGLNPRQQADVTAFAYEYKRSTKSKLLIRVPVLDPVGAMSGDRAYAARAPHLAPAVQATLTGVQKALANAGVDRRHILVAHVAAASTADPLVLVYDGFGAQVATACGEWPQDLATGGDPQGWWNQTYWNFGCATQSNLARQAADPLDLVRPRPESAPDAARAVRGIEMLREGKNPSTAYAAAPANASGDGN